MDSRRKKKSKEEEMLVSWDFPFLMAGRGR
jgi:hypothetical protein